MVIIRGNSAENDPSSDEARNARRRRNQRENEELARYLLDRISLYLHLFFKGVNKFIIRYRFKEVASAVYVGLQRYPLLALSIAAVVFIMTLPFVIFIFFTLTTAVLTFSSFIFIEGTLITVASMLMVGFLIGVFFLAAFVGSLFLMGYFGISKVFDCLTRQGPGNDASPQVETAGE
ncbi:uncharacterized protein LOC129761750 [Toxorhynchites rutilus septentrionalis]|uniref:uncharacterized protein LOC129761750 n=1 Tax=Toxorhynchites rutilus septentrionalis TaxID=329112 RepID=UPI002479177E|nr:uncharacterized protein LOC129761750 [Toxorhynchites rutilus septentrionalis]